MVQPTLQGYSLVNTNSFPKKIRLLFEACSSCLIPLGALACLKIIRKSSVGAILWCGETNPSQTKPIANFFIYLTGLVAQNQTYMFTLEVKDASSNLPKTFCQLNFFKAINIFPPTTSIYILKVYNQINTKIYT